MTLNNPRFPIGPFTVPTDIDEAARRACIDDIEALPEQLRKAIEGLDETQLDTPYREGGWTVRQLVHHVADSHVNALIRFKLALTEDQPTIRPYLQERWAELADSQGPIEVPLNLLTALHHRWIVLLRSLKDADFQRLFVHPEMADKMTIDALLALYSWHSRHHLAHVTELRRNKSW